MLKIKDLTVNVLDKIILKDFNLEIPDGSVHAIMGINGVGKSTICKVILGDPNYEVVSGSIYYNDQDLLKLNTTDRARLGIYLVNQNPIEIEGVSNSEMLRTALGEKNNSYVDIFEFNKEVTEACDVLNIDKDFIHRGINEGMSGGERKKNELLQLWMLKPSLILLDELDSGLDVDSLKILSEALKEYIEKNKASLLIITHHTSILDYLKPDKVHLLSNGEIVKSGDVSLAYKLEKDGFNSFLGQIK